MTAVRTSKYSIVTANPLATQAACSILDKGGTAADALVAAQAALGLVEPQSSGIGGGGFLLYYDAAADTVQAYDGREVAPAASTENYLRWISDTDRTQPKPDARASGRSIGVPGILRLLQDVHTEHGKTAWRDLFTSTVKMADDGFEISPRLAAAIADAAAQLKLDPNASGYFLNSDGSPKASGTLLTNPAYSKTLGTIASDPQSFYTGDIAKAIVAAATDTAGVRTPSLMTLQDLSGYTAKKRDPLCTPYRGKEICGMPPPSSGGIAAAATLGMLEHFPMADHKPTDVDLNGGKPAVMGVHLIAEAERLAYADRDKYVADTDFVPLPGGSPDTLLGSDYLAGRAALISDQHTMGTAKPGDFGVPTTPAPPIPEHGTSQISIVDAQGNAASMTTTVESAFGSFHMVDGFILNNQLTDFSAEPTKDGVPVPNRVEPGKRPRSTMAPTLVFNLTDPAKAKRQLYAVAGSPGGSVIIQFVVKTLVGMIDWGLDPQQAVSAVDFGAANTPKTNVGGEHPDIDTSDNGDHDPLVQGLRKLGHQVDLADQSSGLSAIVRDAGGWVGGADPRREGVVMGPFR
jgi:gamma-glutamyltranspeptidase/glutathione hydrolase